MSHSKSRPTSLDPDLAASTASSPSHSAGDVPSLLKSSGSQKRSDKKKSSMSPEDSEESGSNTLGYASSLEPPSALKGTKRDGVDEMATLLESPKSSSDNISDSPKPIRKTKSPKPQPSSDKILTPKKKSPRSSSVDGRRKLKKSLDGEGSGSSNSVPSGTTTEFRRTRHQDSQSEDDSTSDSNPAASNAITRPYSPVSSSSLDSTTTSGSSHHSSKKHRDKVSSSLPSGENGEPSVLEVRTMDKRPAGIPKMSKSKSSGGGSRGADSLLVVPSHTTTKASSNTLSKSSSASESIAEATSGSDQTSPRIDKGRQHTASLLMDVLRSPDHVKLLHQHMEAGQCDENLDFWLAVEALKLRLVLLSTRQGGVPLDAKTILKEGMDIYQTFIDARAPRPLNLPSKISAKLKHGFKAENPSFPITDELFDEAQNCSFKVIECDPFPRFLSSVGSSITSGLLQLGHQLPDAEFEEFLASIDPSPSTSSKHKWSKVSDDDGVRITKIEAHGQVLLKATMEMVGTVKNIGIFIAHHQFWPSWYRPGSNYIEIESLGPHLSIIYLQVPSAKDTFRDVVLAVGSKHESTISITIFKSIPHISAPTPEDTTRLHIQTSGWRVIPCPDNPGSVQITFLLKAGKSETKRWEKEVVNQHTAMVQLRKVASPPPPRPVSTSSSS